MFASTLYRWTFQNFPFFATMTITSFGFLISTMALAVACRINFGKGLPQYCKLYPSVWKWSYGADNEYPSPLTVVKTEDTFDFSSFVPVLLPRRSKDERNGSRAVSVVFPDRPPRESTEEKVLDPFKVDGEAQPNVIDIKAGEIIPIPELESQLSFKPSDNVLAPPPRASRRSVFRPRLSRARQSFMTMLSTSTYVPQTPAPHPEAANRFQVPEINIIPSSTRQSNQLTDKSDDAASYRTFGSQDGRLGAGRGSRGRSVGLPSNPRPNRT